MRAGCMLVVWAMATPGTMAFMRFSSQPPGSQLMPRARGGHKMEAERVSFPTLDVASFRHPLDKDLTEAVRRSPVAILESFARTVGASTIEQSMRLDNLAFSLRVSETQLPSVHKLFVEAAGILGIEKIPELYVRSDPRPNAYTLAVDGAAPFVVLTSSLVDLVAEDELQAIMGHELGHLKCEHSLWLLLGQILAGGLLRLPVLDDVALNLLRNWRRAAEYTCDRAALLVVQDPAVVVAALLKLLSGVGGYGDFSLLQRKNLNDVSRPPQKRRPTTSLSADAYLRQAEDYEAALKSASPLVRSSFRMQVAGLTHPLPMDRVLELRRWSQSRDFHTLLARGTSLPSSESEEDPSR